MTQTDTPRPTRRSTHAGISFLVFVGGALLVCGFIFVAYTGRALIIPLICAVVLWYLINLISNGFHRIPLPVGKIPQWCSLVFAFATIILAMWIVYAIIASNAATALVLLQNAGAQGTSMVPSEILDSLRSFTETLPSWAVIPIPTDAEIAQSISVIFADLQQYVSVLWSTTSQTITRVTATASTVGVVLLYLVFIFLEQGTFEKKVRALTETEQNYAAWRTTAIDVTEKLKAYVVIKTLMSLLTAIISLVVCVVFGVQFALFWALSVFILNFIPVIGSIIAWFLPMIVVVLGDYSMLETLSIGALLLGAQQLVGAVIEPRVAGNALNLSPLVILLSLAAWGALWGVVGLFLAVPLTVVLTTILARFQGTRWVAILLSQDGSIANLNDDELA